MDISRVNRNREARKRVTKIIFIFKNPLLIHRLQKSSNNWVRSFCFSYRELEGYNNLSKTGQNYTARKQILLEIFSLFPWQRWYSFAKSKKFPTIFFVIVARVNKFALIYAIYYHENHCQNYDKNYKIILLQKFKHISHMFHIQLGKSFYFTLFSAYKLEILTCRKNTKNSYSSLITLRIYF